MNIVQYPSFEILAESPISDYWRIAEGARTCYKSESRGTDSDKRLISSCFENGHHSVLEHSSVTVRFICDRGVSHEIVRHRLASFSQESTRYCNYSKDKFGGEITVVKPVRIHEGSMEYYIWEKSCEQDEKAYFDLLDLGVTPENARSVLPTCLKTEVVMTANLREWYHILKLRTARDAHPDIRYMCHDLLIHMAKNYPEIFGELLRERNREFINDFVNKTKKGMNND